MSLVALLVSSAWAQGCPEPTRTVALQREVELAEFALADLDDAGLRTHRDTAVQTALCLGELVHPPHAAAFLRLEATFAFVNQQEEFAVEAFRAALTIQPNFQLRAAIAPPGGPLDLLYQRARGDAPTMWALPRLAKPVFVNGLSTTHAPAGLSIIQVMEPNGTLGWTGIVRGPADLPPWFVDAPPPAPVQPTPLPQPAPTPVPEPLPSPEPVAVVPLPDPVPDPIDPTLDPLGFDPLDEGPAKKTAKVPLLVAGGIGLVAAGGLLAGSAVTRVRYDAAPTFERRRLTNILYLGAAGTGIVGLGIGTVGIALPSKKKSRDREPGETGVY